MVSFRRRNEAVGGCGQGLTSWCCSLDVRAHGNPVSVDRQRRLAWRQCSDRNPVELTAVVLQHRLAGAGQEKPWRRAGNALALAGAAGGCGPSVTFSHFIPASMEVAVGALGAWLSRPLSAAHPRPGMSLLLFTGMLGSLGAVSVSEVEASEASTPHSAQLDLSIPVSPSDLVPELPGHDSGPAKACTVVTLRPSIPGFSTESEPPQGIDGVDITDETELEQVREKASYAQSRVDYRNPYFAEQVGIDAAQRAWCEFAKNARASAYRLRAGTACKGLTEFLTAIHANRQMAEADGRKLANYLGTEGVSAGNKLAVIDSWWAKHSGMPIMFKSWVAKQRLLYRQKLPTRDAKDIGWQPSDGISPSNKYVAKVEDLINGLQLLRVEAARPDLCRSAVAELASEALIISSSIELSLQALAAEQKSSAAFWKFAGAARGQAMIEINGLGPMLNPRFLARQPPQRSNRPDSPEQLRVPSEIRVPQP